MKHAIEKMFWFAVGVLFAGFGVYFLFETSVPTFYSWQEMKDWQPAQARLLSVGGSNNRTLATYRYTFKGMAYENDRVYLAAFNDNIGKYHQHLHRRLNQSLAAKEPVRIYYNPDQPGESVIDREMRWGLFILMTAFCLVFLLIGLCICIGSLRWSGKNRFIPPKTDQLKREWDIKRKDPAYRESFIEFRQYRLHGLKQAADKKNNPRKTTPGSWQDRKPWKTDHIRSDAKASFVSMWIFAILWLAVSSPIYFLSPVDFSRPNLSLLLLLFPVVGLFLLFKAISLTQEYFKFGRIEFVMDPYPGSIGGQVGGWLDLTKNYDEKADYKIELQCVYTYMSGTGDSRRRLERIKWFQEGTAQKKFHRRQLQLRFTFDVPKDLPEADIEQQGDYYFWRLKADARMSGLDFERSYNIPVYSSQTSSQKVTHNLSLQGQTIVENDIKIRAKQFQLGQFDLAGLKKSVRITDTPSQFTLYFPMFRNGLLTFFAVLFGGVSSGITYALVSHMHHGMVVGIIMGLIALPFAALALFTVLSAIYLPFNTLRSTFADKKIIVQRRLLFFPIYTKIFDTKDIQSLTIGRSGSTGEGSKKVEHFKIFAMTTTGKKWCIAENIDGNELAKEFKAYLYQRFFTTGNNG